jgi:hypothetical protein
MTGTPVVLAASVNSLLQTYVAEDVMVVVQYCSKGFFQLQKGDLGFVVSWKLGLLWELCVRRHDDQRWNGMT